MKGWSRFGVSLSGARGKQPITINTVQPQRWQDSHQSNSASLCLFCQHPKSKPLSLEWSVQTIKMEPLCTITLNMSDRKMKGASCIGAARRDASCDKPHGESALRRRNDGTVQILNMFWHKIKSCSALWGRDSPFPVWSLIRPLGERGRNTDTWIFSLHFLWHFFFFFSRSGNHFTLWDIISY